MSSSGDDIEAGAGREEQDQPPAQPSDIPGLGPGGVPEDDSPPTPSAPINIPSVPNVSVPDVNFPSAGQVADAVTNRLRPLLNQVEVDLGPLSNQIEDVRRDLQQFVLGQAQRVINDLGDEIGAVETAVRDLEDEVENIRLPDVPEPPTVAEIVTAVEDTVVEPALATIDEGLGDLDEQVGQLGQDLAAVQDDLTAAQETLVDVQQAIEGLEIPTREDVREAVREALPEGRILDEPVAVLADGIERALEEAVDDETRQDLRESLTDDNE